MKKYLLFLFTLIMGPVAFVAATDLYGTLINNTTLTAENSPYTVTGNVNVNEGITLTIESGVELRFNSGVYLQVFGTLNANEATFTANGSTNKGYWPGIYVSYEHSSSVGNVVLNNCIVEYAQSLFVRKGELTLTGNTVIKDFSSYGVDVYDAGTVNIDATTIQNCTYPVYFRGNGNWVTGAGITLTGNDNDYIFIDFRDVNNDFTLPALGVPYYYNSELRITETGTLRIDPGVSMFGNVNAYISVNGKLKAQGTSGNPVIFSNDPASDHWDGINFNDAAIDTACILNYCKFTGANYSYYNSRNSEISTCAVEINRSSPSFGNCEFSNNRYNLVVTGRSFPVFTDCNFMQSNLVDKQTVNINIDLNAEPEFTNCSMEFNNSESRAIGIIGSTVYDDSQVRSYSFTGIDSISYTLYGNVIIHDTASLVIDPGIVIKCTDNDYYIQANGALNAVGTESKPIIFTHINDDNYGKPADTHNDGTTSIGASSSGRIILSGQPTSTIEYWKILYGGLNSSNYAVTAYNGNIVKNCLIKDSHRGIIFSGDAQLLNNTLENIPIYPFSRRMNEGSPVMIGNNIINSGHLGIFVYDFMDGTYSVEGLDIGSNTNVAYIIDHDTQIPLNADVTILPGTIFKFVSYYGKLSVRGGLKAEGTKSNKIIFTSIYDNSAAGNTNYNTGSDPTGYKWNGIEYYDSSDDGLNMLKNCEVRYVNDGLKMTNCRVVIDSILLNFANRYALEIYGNANPVVTNSAFNNLSNPPIHMDMFANPSFSGNSVANVSQMGISINGGTLSGTIPVRSFAGYDTITYFTFQNIRVDDQLTIPAGLTFKCNNTAYFDIHGTLNVLGTADNPVVFTSLQDDAYGKPADSELNGQGYINKYGNRIVFRDLSDDNSIINHALFRYSNDYAVYTEQASPTIKNSTFYNTNRCGLYLIGSSAPTVDSCVFEDLQYPLITSLMTFPGSHQGNVITGTTPRGIFIIDNETLTQNYTLNKRSFAGIENIPYVFDRYNIGTSAVLTIAPGVVCKFRSNGYLLVRNGLIADGGGTPDSAIIFTADRDDFYGGDTYADGDANLPTERWWQGIYFPEESIDASCFVDNAIIKNASYLYSNSANGNNRGGITINNASPTIRNTLFEDNYWSVIVRNTSLPVISNCDFVETNPTYGYGVWNETGTVNVTAENCWWNDATGPYHPTLNSGGLGERVSDGVDFTPWISQTAKPIMGDVSLNGEVMPYDASLVLQHTVGNITLDAKQSAVADVSGDGTVSSYDASLILQYTIGLITNFDQSLKKSATATNNLMISAPADLRASSGTRFELPLAISTPASVKAVDIQFALDPEQLRFIELNSDNFPPDIMVASGYSENSGILKVSFTSAYDLGLNLNELKLIFEMKETAGKNPAIELVKIAANEIELDETLVVTVENTNSTTGLPVASGLSSLNVHSNHEMIIADLDLSSVQSKLIFTVYDLTGRMTHNMVIENPGKGPQRFFIPAESEGGISSSIYLLTIRGDNFTVTRKLVLR